MKIVLRYCNFSKRRFFAIGNGRRLADSVFVSAKNSCSDVNRKGVSAPARFPIILSHVYSKWKVSFKGYVASSMNESKQTLFNRRIGRNVLFSNSGTLSYHSQVAWKKLFHICSNGGPILSPLSKTAYAISFALARSQLVGSGILAFFIGKLAWNENFWAEAEGFPTRDSVYMHAQDLCNELSKLHTRAPAQSYAHTKTTIENAFGCRLVDIVENFEEEPVASGSVAQVHRATLRFQYHGKEVKPTLVAVKVRHPGVQESIRRDFMLINLFAKFSHFIPALKWMRLDESLRQFAVFMMSQVDLAREAANLNRFIYNFHRWKDVSFPRPLYPFVHPAVLVETFEHGENVLHYVDSVKGHDHVGSSLAQIGAKALLKMLLVDNFIHADLHPGNILVRVSHGKPSPKRVFKLRPHIIFLDVGMTAELSQKD